TGRETLRRTRKNRRGGKVEGRSAVSTLGRRGRRGARDSAPSVAPGRGSPGASPESPGRSIPSGSHWAFDRASPRRATPPGPHCARPVPSEAVAFVPRREDVMRQVYRAAAAATLALTAVALCAAAADPQDAGRAPPKPQLPVAQAKNP